MGIPDVLEAGIKTHTELRKRGVRHLIGGDYGFAWSPNGTNARDLQFFVDYYGYTLIDNPLSIPAYLHSLKEYQTAKRIARKHRIAIILYSKSRRVLEAEEFGLAILVRDYYNSIRKIIPNKNKPEIINDLLIVL